MMASASPPGEELPIPPWADLAAFRARHLIDNPIPGKSAVPVELVYRQQWLVWRYEPGETPEKKPRKMPYYADGRRRVSSQGSDSDRARLAVFSVAAETARDGGYDGVGFAFLPDDGLIGIDLDGMIDPETGVISERCASIIAACASYTEYSPSGKGVHILCSGEGVTTKSNRIGVEVFVGRQYFTFTGRRWPGSPLVVTALDPAVVRRLQATVRAARAPTAARAVPAADVPAEKPETIGGKVRSRAETVALAEDALTALTADDYGQWIEIGMACKAGLGTAGYFVWDAWSATSQKYAGGEDTRRRFDGFAVEKITLGTLFGLAEQAGWVSPWAKARERRPRAARKVEPEYASPALPDSSARAKSPAGDDDPPPADEDQGGSAGEAPDEIAQWKRSLIRKKGDIVPCLANAELILDRMPIWSAVIGYDDFSERTVFRGRLPFDPEARFPGEWSDHLDVMAAIWIQRAFRIDFSPSVVGQAVEACARKHRFHPVREALQKLPPWDGARRLPEWLSDYLGVERTEYSALVGTYFIRGMIRRVMHQGRDGYKFDYCPVLEGPQGLGKSEVCRILAWDWFCDTDLDLTNKDSLLALPGHWVYEIPELGGLMKAEERKQKSFLSRQTDEFRPPYGKRLVKVPRQNVFIGTTNEEEYLKDPTGGRRFWPLCCGDTFNLEGLRGAREQMYAEALHDLRNGERCWPDRDEQKRLFDPEQAKRGMDEPFEDLLLEWVQCRVAPFSTADVAVEALKLSADKLTPAIVTRLGIALKRLGCWRQEDRLAADSSRRRLYVTKNMSSRTSFGGVVNAGEGRNEPF